MPVPKGKQRAYGVIVGKNINEGKSLEQAKDIADKAIEHKSAIKSIAKMLKKKKRGK